MLGMCSDCRMGAMARVTALSAVPSIATSPWLAILRASSVPTVGSPWSSSRARVIFRPSTPPAALAWSAASLTPRYSNWPRSLDDPLCASTTAILIGPDPDPPPPKCLTERRPEIVRSGDRVTVGAARPRQCGEVRAVRAAAGVAELAAVAAAEAGRLQVGDGPVGAVVHHHEDHRQPLLDRHR